LLREPLTRGRKQTCHTTQEGVARVVRATGIQASRVSRTAQWCDSAEQATKSRLVMVMVVVVVLVVAVAVVVVVVVMMMMVEGTEFGSAYTHRSHVGSCLVHPFCGIPQCLCVRPSLNLDCRPDGVMRVQDMLCGLTRSLAKMRLQTKEVKKRSQHNTNSCLMSSKPERELHHATQGYMPVMPPTRAACTMR
jgi:hypothetical protein